MTDPSLEGARGGPQTEEDSGPGWVASEPEWAGSRCVSPGGSRKDTASLSSRGLGRQAGRPDGTGVTVGTTLSTVPGQLPFPLSRGCTDRLGLDLPGRREGHIASHVPWPLPSSSVCLSRALGQSSVSRKRLCWASPPPRPPYLGSTREGVWSACPPQDRMQGWRSCSWKEHPSRRGSPSLVGSGLPAYLGTAA